MESFIEKKVLLILTGVRYSWTLWKRDLISQPMRNNRVLDYGLISREECAEK